MFIPNMGLLTSAKAIEICNGNSIEEISGRSQNRKSIEQKPVMTQ